MDEREGTARKERLLSTQAISEDEYRALVKKSKRGSLLAEDQTKMRRHEVERFYVRPVSMELIENDREGTYRNEIRTFELLECNEDDLDGWWLRLQSDAHVHYVTNIDKNESRARKRLLVKLFTAADVSETGVGFKIDVVVTMDSLSGFINVCRTEKVAIERLLETNLRRDLSGKPTRQLTEFLKQFGLSLKKAGTKKQEDAKVYRYTVNPDKLAMIQEDVRRRKDPAVKAEWEALQRERFPVDDELDREIEAVRECRSRERATAQASAGSEGPSTEDDMDRIQRELDGQAERYARAPEEAPTELDF